MFDRDVEDAFRDVVEPDVVRVPNPLFDREGCVERLEGAAGQRRVEGHFAAREALGVEQAGQDTDIGHGRVVAAAAVARRPGVRAGTLRTHGDVSRGGHRDDAAPARTDTRNVVRECVHDQVVFELEGRVDEGSSLGDETDVAGGPTDVGTEQVPLADDFAKMSAAHGSRSGAREHHPEGVRHRVRRGHEVRGAVGEVELARKARRAKPGVESLGVLLVDDLHEHIDQGGRRAGVFFCERRDLAGDRTGNVAQLLAHQLAQPSFVGVVHVGVQQADRDALDIAATEDLDLLSRLGLVERRKHLARGGHAFGDAAAQIALDQRSHGIAKGPPPGRVGHRRAGSPATPHVGDVAVPQRREESDLGERTRDDRVESVGARVVEHRRGLDVELAGAFEHRLVHLLYVGGDFRGADRALLDRHHISEGPSDIDCHHGASAPASRSVGAARWRPSRARCGRAGSTSPGSASADNSDISPP